MATLRELRQEPFKTVLAGTGPAGRLPVTAPDDRWVVLVGADGPVTAVAPGTTLAEAARPPGILVAAADLDQAVAFGSAAFREITEVDALVLTRPGGSAGDGSPTADVVAGVVGGATLTRALLRGPVRGDVTVLPGVPSVPLISRSCGYTERRGPCATVMSFPRRPATMPQCPNGRGLAAHSFIW